MSEHYLQRTVHVDGSLWQIISDDHNGRLGIMKVPDGMTSLPPNAIGETRGISYDEFHTWDRPPLIVPVLEFIPPRGRQQPRQYSVPDPDGTLAERLAAVQEAGCRLTIETLRLQGGFVSICIEDPDVGDYDAELLSPSQPVEPVIATMLGRFDEETFREWRAYETAE